MAEYLEHESFCQSDRQSLHRMTGIGIQYQIHIFKYSFYTPQIGVLLTVFNLMCHTGVDEENTSGKRVY